MSCRRWIGSGRSRFRLTNGDDKGVDVSTRCGLGGCNRVRPGFVVSSRRGRPRGTIAFLHGGTTNRAPFYGIVTGVAIVKAIRRDLFEVHALRPLIEDVWQMFLIAHIVLAQIDDNYVLSLHRYPDATCALCDVCSRRVAGLSIRPRRRFSALSCPRQGERVRRAWRC